MKINWKETTTEMTLQLEWRCKIFHFTEFLFFNLDFIPSASSVLVSFCVKVTVVLLWPFSQDSGYQHNYRRAGRHNNSGRNHCLFCYSFHFHFWFYVWCHQHISTAKFSNLGFDVFFLQLKIINMSFCVISTPQQPGVILLRWAAQTGRERSQLWTRVMGIPCLFPLWRSHSLHMDTTTPPCCLCSSTHSPSLCEWPSLPLALPTSLREISTSRLYLTSSIAT